ncbi:MAG TPA: hypothetical protein VKW77_11355, partial [Acidimicrobiales bacterium]|nr:hypothetical protein [Acidimicrobiales bacterium]
MVADLFWLAPGVAGNLGWNPNVALVFLSSAVALSWVVASGSIGWWPALVAVASVAAQCHLFYAIVAVLLVLGAPLICLLVAGRPSSWRWLLGGAAVGLVCWWAPVVQQLTGHPGNLSELLAHGRQGRAAGIRFGLDQMARGALRPTWATGPPSPTASPAAGVGSSGAVVGVLLLLSGAAVAGWARRRRQPSLAALVAVWAVLAGGLALSFSALPRRNLAIYLAYLDNSLVPLGFVAWAIAAWSVLEVVRGRSTQATGPARTGPAPRTPVGRGVLVAGLAIAVGLVAATAGELPSAAATADNTGAAVKVNERVATMVERLVPRGPVGIELEPGLRVDRVYLAWRLVADGWEPGLAPDYDPALCRGPVLEPSLAADCALHLPATY